ncbi:MAG: hypothetical protein UHN88_01180, partial [Eubacterium sp.]|nr:hypothetical protein [Eubacterium sp.]
LFLIILAFYCFLGSLSSVGQQFLRFPAIFLFPRPRQAAPDNKSCDFRLFCCSLGPAKQRRTTNPVTSEYFVVSSSP